MEFCCGASGPELGCSCCEQQPTSTKRWAEASQQVNEAAHYDILPAMSRALALLGLECTDAAPCHLNCTTTPLRQPTPWPVPLAARGVVSREATHGHTKTIPESSVEPINARVQVGEEVLGLAAKVVVSKEATTIVGDGSSEQAVQARIKQIRNMAAETEQEYEKEKLQERIARLSGGVAVIQVSRRPFKG